MDLATAGGFCLLGACMCFVSCFYTNFSDNQDADEQKDDVKYENGFLLWCKRVYHFNTC